MGVTAPSFYMETETKIVCVCAESNLLVKSFFIAPYISFILIRLCCVRLDERERIKSATWEFLLHCLGDSVLLGKLLLFLL